ncbi:MAG: hypothetical protein AUJ98_06950 [Bacteroidetes bacterium CG2_30_33_31]|nr:MAG: hypothetical protein AUJ98_06950 [Bacteroidetes bacterium CG2_30_33_31]
MKLSLIIIVIIVSISYSKINAQKIYGSSNGEIILSFSNSTYNNFPNIGDTKKIDAAPRFTIWPHFASIINVDFNKNFGIFFGISLKNIGIITKEKSSDINTNEDVKWKRRAYALGIPLSIKLGKLENGYYFFAGCQYDWLFHYKEKEFMSSGKRKSSEWFSNKVNSFVPSIFIGMASPQAYSFKITYSLIDFMNNGYSYSKSGTLVEPYKNMNSKIIYLSVFMTTRWDKYLESEKQTKKIASL